MQRRRLLRLTPMLPLGFLISRYVSALAPNPSRPVDYPAQALKLDELATGIHTVTDARSLVDFIADMFSDQLKPARIDSRFRAQIAEAEFASVSRPDRLIPEQRLAGAWNIFAKTIKAPANCQVTTAELHNLRDSLFTSTRLLWARGSRNVWAVPGIYATQADGSMATGCRAIESIRVLWDLATMPDNLSSTRVCVNQGVLASEVFSRAQAHPTITAARSYVSTGPGTRNPVDAAAREYVARGGTKAFSKALEAMLNQAFS
jgi:hypothetical protein